MKLSYKQVMNLSQKSRLLQQLLPFLALAKSQALSTTAANQTYFLLLTACLHQPLKTPRIGLHCQKHHTVALQKLHHCSTEIIEPRY